MPPKIHTLLLALSIACASPLPAAAVTLPNFADQATLQSAVAAGSKLSLVTNGSGPALRVMAGLDHRWPGATFHYPAGLNLSGHGDLVVPLCSPGAAPLRIHCRIDSRPQDSPAGTPALSRTFHLDLAGGQRGDLRIPLIPHLRLPNLKEDELFGMRGIPFFNNSSIHPNNITGLLFFVSDLKSPQVFEIGQPRLEGAARPADPIPANPFPLIDGFGQFKHREWPGKTHSVEELRARRDEEAKLLASSPRPPSWNRFGGWQDGPQLDATGWFRTTRHDGKWHLVDPDGRLFFSLGIDCVRQGNDTPLDDRRHWFEALPPDDPAHREFYGQSMSHMEKYHYFNRKVRTFNHYQFNVMRKYGDDWQQAFAATCAARLPAWGINTIGNWSDSAVYSLQKVPYVAFLSTNAPPIQGSSGYWGKFDDVFHPDFKDKLRQRLQAEEIAITRDDPWCIGYFVDNELGWGEETSLATAALASPAGQIAKQVFIADLKAKYGTVDALNKTWLTDHATWDALLAATKPPEVKNAGPDLVAFYEKLSDTYFCGIREVLREFAPHHLYLGCRFAWANPVTVKVAARHCDVVSFNFYTRQLGTKLPILEQAGDIPCIIGEFHFGALDRGLFHTGLVPVPDQAERAQAFTDYVAACLAHPNIVGCHWFQFTDSPTTGRSLDGENYQIGFTDTCDTPYPELIKASRAVGGSLYQKRAAK